MRMSQVSLPSYGERHGAPCEFDGSRGIVCRQSRHRDAEVAIEVHRILWLPVDYALEAAARLRQLAAREVYTTLHQQLCASRRAVCRRTGMLEQLRESIQITLCIVELPRIAVLAEHHRDRGFSDQT